MLYVSRLKSSIQPLSLLMWAVHRCLIMFYSCAFLRTSLFPVRIPGKKGEKYYRKRFYEEVKAGKKAENAKSFYPEQ